MVLQCHMEKHTGQGIKTQKYTQLHLLLLCCNLCDTCAFHSHDAAEILLPTMVGAAVSANTLISFFAR